MVPGRFFGANLGIATSVAFFHFSGRRSDEHTLSEQAMSEWHHFAILEMLQLPDFIFDSKRVAHQLGITQLEVKEAIARMERLGVVYTDDKNQPRKSEVHIQVASEAKSEALRNFHCKMLEKAAKSIRNRSPKERFVGSETLIFDDADLSAAPEIFEDCFQKVIDLSGSSSGTRGGGDADAVAFFAYAKQIAQWIRVSHSEVTSQDTNAFAEMAEQISQKMDSESGPAIISVE